MRRPTLAPLLAALALTLAALTPPSRADGERVSATNLPTCADGDPFLVYIVDASADDDCDTTAGGTTEAPCLCLDGSYVAMLAAGGGGGGDSFKTQNTPAGTDPVADSSTDTLNWTAGTGITITGDSSTDTITVASTVPSITLDLGDDGGSDSTALAEVATSGDDYGAVTEPSADKALVNFGQIAPYRQYDPNRPPSSCDTCEEWTGDTAAQSWSWGNQDAASEVIGYDSALFTGDSADEERFRWVAAPANSDQTLTAKLQVLSVAGVADACQVATLVSGTIASPTSIEIFQYAKSGTSSYGFAFYVDDNYSPAAGVTLHGSFYSIWESTEVLQQHVFMQIRYTDSSRSTETWLSWNAKDWYQVGTAATAAADPAYWGYGARKGAQCRYEFFRVRTDANRNDVSD